MHKRFDHTEIEKKWQSRWSESNLHATDDGSSKPKQYVLDMFPYPSGEGLHVGHPKGYIATDVYSRFKKMSGFEVLHPMGWDAFGLPAENYAIKNKVHPSVAVEKNVANFKAQLAKLGFNYDWSKEINTTDPNFYKWTQWIFLKLLEKGLAYESYEPINWCPSCQTGLANEDLESDGTCERCGSIVEKRPMRQWVLKITDYADRMLKDLDQLTKWPQHVKEAQRQWIGKSEGAEIDFPLQFTKDPSANDHRGPDGEKAQITVFTTRPDTLYGATYLVLAPEHLWVTLATDDNHDVLENKGEIIEYVKQAKQKSEIDRTNAAKDKTGVLIKGVHAINPATGEVIPMYVADYVLAGYGTGAIMAVPAHDERDFAFAKKFNLPIKQVVRKVFGEPLPDPVPRVAVGAIVHDPKSNKYLVQYSNEFKKYSFIFGGLEEGEDYSEAAVRETLEETGYQAKFIRYITDETESHFYHPGKNINRSLVSRRALLELAEADPQVVSEEELQKGVPVWLTAEELKVKLDAPEEAYAVQMLHAFSPYTGPGNLINSGEFDGVSSEKAGTAITKKVGGRMMNTYRIKDWVFSRQRYWGEPIPVVHCEKCGVVPVPYEQLPVTLPQVEQYAPTGTGESPLADIAEWVNTKCPNCGGLAKRETNTMPQWAGSSWYYLRFIDPENNVSLIDPEKEKKWMPVDVYVGGDHAVRHLIYARFWHKFLYDLGVVHTIEPFERLEFLGFILAPDGRKMSKRWGNIINPDDIVQTNGADTLRVYEMFMGPFENTVSWSTDSLVGAQRFLERGYGLAAHVSESESEETVRLLHKTIQKVSDDIESFKFNTAVSALMIFLNHAEKHGLSADSYKTFLQLVAPFAPHLAEELWELAGEKTSIHLSVWPMADSARIVEEEVNIGVQINGKMRGLVKVAQGATEADVLSAVRSDEQLSAKIQEEPKKIIFVKNKIISIIF